MAGKSTEDTILDNFKLFVDENYAKCINVPSHPPDYAKIIEWQCSQCGEIPREFSFLVGKYLRHISFTEFHSKLAQLASAIRQMNNENKYEDIYIVIFGGLNKSNFWVSILLFRLLENIITGILDNGSGKMAYWANNKKILLLVPDDMSYMGGQLSANLLNFSGLIPGMDILTRENITTLIACPYIGIGAKIVFFNIKPKHNVIISGVSEIIPTFLDYIIRDNPVGRKLVDRKIMTKYFVFDRAYYKAFLYKYTLYLIYFDHKLADGVSIFQKMLALGTYYNCDNTIGLMGPLIQNCKLENYKVKNIPPSPDQLFDDFDKTNVCPLPYYKTIQYTYKGNIINTKDEINMAKIF